jgi:hypothetical protein
MFNFLLVFKLFPIGYGPTPNKIKDIVLEQEIVKVFYLVLHRKKENIFYKRLSICKVNGSPFPSDSIQGASNVSKRVGGVEEFFSKCCKFSNVEECSLSS